MLAYAPSRSCTQPQNVPVTRTRAGCTVATARSEPAGASGSQFFVVTALDAGLPPDYALVGRVTTGREVVNRIASVPTGENERPVSPIVIERAKLRRP